MKRLFKILVFGFVGLCLCLTAVALITGPTAPSSNRASTSLPIAASSSNVNTEQTKQKPTTVPPMTNTPSPTAEATALPAGYVSRAQYGKKWPFTVEEGVIACIGPVNRVVFISGGKTYALNGTAQGGREKRGWLHFEEIWAKDPEYANIKGAEEFKIDVQPFIYMGLDICSKQLAQ